MDGFLLDTGVLSRLFDPTRPSHATAWERVAAIGDAPKYVSAISIGEIRLGVELASADKPALRVDLEEILHRILSYSEPLALSRHTAEEYGRLKSGLALALLNKALRKEGRSRWVEEWIDHATGMKLQADENDLWMCAQALERNLVFLSHDKKLLRVSQHYQRLKLEITS